MVEVAVPAEDGVPAAFETTQLRTAEPAAPAVKVTEVVVPPAVMVPPVMLQA